LLNKNFGSQLCGPRIRHCIVLNVLKKLTLALETEP